MALTLTDSGAQYSTGMGLIYVFNLIVGTGALAMPKPFQSAGWLLSLFTIIILAFISYITVTFMVEAMAIANAKLRKEKELELQDENSPTDGTEYTVTEEAPLLQRKVTNTFEITQRVEMGQMAEMFFNKVGFFLFNLCIIIYLYGDLAIYAVAVPKSVRDVACTFARTNQTSNATLSGTDPCWEGVDLTRQNAYRIFVAVFFCLLGPFVFFNVQKTKYLQMCTTAARWIAFGMMIVLAVIQLSEGKGQGHPVAADLTNVPNLFGVCVYAFMCHHSLPSLITPMRNKAHLFVVLGGDYLLIMIFYIILCFTGIFTFQTIEDLYTLNFQPNQSGRQTITNIKFIQYFLALFPVFTLSTNFPIISVTLRNNLQASIMKPSYSMLVNHIFIPLLAIIPPIIIAVITDQVDFLVGVTGSYAGAGIQYIIPAFLVLLAWKQVPELQAADQGLLKRSLFSHPVWAYLVLLWSVLCIALVTAYHAIKGS